jgi:hypothetical protein
MTVASAFGVPLALDRPVRLANAALRTARVLADDKFS